MMKIKKNAKQKKFDYKIKTKDIQSDKFVYKLKSISDLSNISQENSSSDDNSIQTRTSSPAQELCVY